MLVLKFEKYGVLLERQVGTQAGASIWEFHRSSNSYATNQGRQVYRYARITPAEPKPGAAVQAVLMQSPTAPESEWVSLGPATTRPASS